MRRCVCESRLVVLMLPPCSVYLLGRPGSHLLWRKMLQRLLGAPRFEFQLEVLRALRVPLLSGK